MTTGAPIALIIENKDWRHWRERMSVTPTETLGPAVTIPRPGHSDLAGAIKYGHESDIRNVLERASARETAMRVAIGAIASTMLRALGIDSIAYVKSIGGIESEFTDDIFSQREKINASAVRVADPKAETAIVATIDRAKANGDTLGGMVECIVRNIPPGIGSHVHWDRKLDAAIASAVMGIQAVKAVEIGAGVKAASQLGSEVHDEIIVERGKLGRSQNNAGGIEGGMSNGEPIIVRAAMKPISTLMQPLGSVDFATGLVTKAHIERSDVCAAPALAIIVEQIVAFTIVTELLETFGGDTMNELKERVEERHKRMHIDKSS